jgi:hypothetical protein
MSEKHHREFEGILHHELLDLFEELTFREKWEKVADGLKQPHDTGEYKFARLQILRLSAPITAVLLPLFTVLILFLISGMAQENNRTYEVSVKDPEKFEEKLDDIKPEPLEPPPEPPEPVDVQVDNPSLSDNAVPGPPGPNTPFSPKPAAFDTVAIIKSPISFKGMYSSRNPGSRGSALGKYGGSGAGEDAVLKALRWLKKNQLPDGSWPTTKPAMTGFALLAYLAHGETPSSVEFGATVERALYFLMDSLRTGGNHFTGADGNDYTHPIAAYALSEAYGLTKNPALRESAAIAIRRIMKGQHGSGGFNYKLESASERNDTSYMAWCAQALKAAKMAGVFDTEETMELDKVMRKAIDGFKQNYQGGGGGDAEYDAGGFGYTGPGKSGLTAAGTLCMQLLGAGREKEARGGLRGMDPWTFEWAGQGNGSVIYHAYYGTQAKFHEGGDTWKKWNLQFSPALVKNQTVEPKAIADANGKMQDIGYWDSASSGHSDGGEGKRVMTTCLCTLMLEVYYRYLPTFQKPEDVGDQANDAPAAVNKNEVKVQVDI